MSTDVQEPLRAKLATLPASPGVYLMKDRRGQVIYVGKAARLAPRVRSYFGSRDQLDPKTRTLVGRIHDFDYVVTPTEKEALLLESQLVKEYRPRYNVRLKDDKRFPYLRLTVTEPFPRIDVVRQPREDGDEYFGPYTDAGAMRLTLKTLTSIFPVRTCSLDLPGESVPRPCLDYYIHRCGAPCVDYVTEEEYREVVDRVRLFLRGQSDALLDRLDERMEEHAQALRFEAAAQVRDTIAAVRKIVSRQEVLLEPGRDVDVLAVEREGKDGCGIVMRVRGGKLLQTETYFLRSALEDAESVFFARFAAEVFGRSPTVGRVVLLADSLVDAEGWSAVLRERHRHPVELRVPRRGRRARLVELARTNARFKLREHLARRGTRAPRRTEEVPEVLDLKRRLELPVAPHTIECFDMSHFQGAQGVGALVFFSDGAPLKSRYRRFKIRQVEGIDDFGMMQEVVERYYSRLRDEDRLPADLVVVDGGAGQLAVAVKTLRRYGYLETSVIGLAKREEEVYLPHRPAPVRLPRSSPGLKLLQRVRDEAHRFAVTFHRHRREKESLKSVLDDIPGIGTVKKRRLLLQFGSAEAVGRAPVEELMRVKGLSSRDVQRIVEFFTAGRGTAP